MKNNIYILFLVSFISTSVFAHKFDKGIDPIDNKNSTPERFYPASLKEGYIGIFDEKPLDSPTDNVFTVNLDVLPKSDEEVWLTYELYGISDHTGISRSINNQVAVGGYFVSLHNGWKEQEEQLNQNWLVKGDNIIRFTLPENALYNYRIKNLGIRVKKTNAAGRAIVINQPTTQEYVNNFGYLKGYVQGKDSQYAQVYVDGIRIRSLASEFEALVSKKAITDSWQATLKVVFPDGDIIQKKISYSTSVKAHYQNNIAIRSANYNIKKYLPENTLSLSVQGARITIDPLALETSKNISITALRDVDIPVLDGGMVNVTKNHKGYRFLPHGTQFNGEATISLEYDAKKIPEGYTEKDVKTYYFDETTKHWVALKKDSVSGTTVLSKTSHFTDMINGIIKVPESPETAGFTPTSIKDIKAANPSAAINTIEPPSANNMGNANIGYPITLPAGRQGMQPQLGIQYNSGGGNDWLGIGWNLQIPSINIDTRWGVPRYNPSLETETYSMGGQMLAPVSHRGELQARSSEKQFYPRVEGSFNKIIRHGDNPTNYWWEVTDKSGTIYSYGGTTTNGIINNSVLKDADGNIAHWALVEVRDLNDNFVRYHCSKVMDVGVHGGSVPGYNIYIDRITYTGHGATEGKYEVIFTRDRELNETKRTDVSINARYGFKQVTADLLRKIEVQFNGQNIRHYELTYTQGAFYKTLLEKITEFDAAGQEFNNHEFEYFDDVKATEGYRPYSTEEIWTPQDDNVHGNFINPIEHFNDDASALSGTKSNNFGFGLAITFGLFDGNLFCKSNTLGGDFSAGRAVSNGILSLIDINGDGLSDKVFMNGNGFNYRPNQSGPEGGTTFGDLKPIAGVNKFYRDKSNTTSYGFQVSAGCANFSAFIGLNRSKSNSQTTIYFTDVNGDQLIDIAVDGQVFFNHIDTNGNPVFTPSSSDTPSPIFNDGTIDPSIFTIDPQEIENAIDQNPLHDVVRLWEAPFDGTVNIDALVNLIAPIESSGTADGVRVAIQHGSTELWNTTIAANDYTSKTPAGVNAITVAKGDRIYFRVQSIFDGTNDQVNWNPIITYTEHTADLVDSNNHPIYQFTAGDDFLVSSAQTTAVPIDGTITIEGTFTKPITSDAITASIIKDSDGSIVWEENFTWNQTATENINLSLLVASGDSFSFMVSADTNIDWSAIGWIPRLYYTASSDPSYPTANLTDSNGNPTLEFYPSVGYSMYTETIHKTMSYEALQDGIITITPSLVLSGTPTGELTFSVKKVNELVEKQQLIVNSGIISGSSPITLDLLTGDKIFIDYHSANQTLINAISQNTATIDVAGVPQTINTGVFTINDEMIFGPQYRNWGQFAYNGNRGRATQPINETELKLDDAFTNGNTIDLSGASNPDEMEQMYNDQGGYNPANSTFIMMIPDTRKQRWQGYDDLTYIEATTISSSRMGQDDLSIVSPIPGNSGGTGSGASAIYKITETTSTSYSLGGGVGSGSFGASGSYSKTESDTRVLSDFIDMNGDSYPDIVTETHIQYTNALGGLSDTATPHNFGVNNLSHNESDGVTLGGTYATADSKGTIYNVKNRTLEVGKGAGGGLSGNFAKGENEIEYSWKDVNGDGLPDRVYEGGNVALNLGYKFAPIELWGYVPVQENKSTSYGAGLGINIGNNSIAGGISLSRSESEGEKALQDVNGDGLVDELILGNPIKVRLNTGNGFGPTILWNGADAISENSSTSEGANVAFTVCIPLPPIIPVSKLCFNPSANIGQGASRELTQIQDLDGDGFPDFLRSTKDNNLTVKRSTIARTNLLKGVKRPLGATFAVDYKREGNTYYHPSNVWALARVAMHDGFEGDGADTMVSTFDYEEGKYDRHERDFYGFKKVKSHQLDTENNDAVYRTVVQEFKTDNYYEKGLLEREVLQDASENLYTETINTFELKDITSGTTLPDSYKLNDANAAFPAATETTKNYYESGSTAEKSMRMTYSYDVLGNVIGYTDFGDTGTADDISSTIAYHNVPSTYIMGTPSSITVTGNGQTFRKRETDIDATGSITQIRKYLETGGVATYDMDYDSYGNLTKMTRPENTGGEKLFFQYEYDPEVITYTTSVTDGYGYSSSSEYDYRFGQMLLSTDLNKHQIRYTIDDLGRITTITGPFELEAGLPYTIAFDYHPEATVPWASTKHYDPAHPTNDLETVTFIDGLKRSLQVKKDGAIHTAPNGADNEQMIVSGRLTFDAFGRATESYYPETESKGSESNFNATYDGIASTKTTYDILDRALTVTLPDAAITETKYGFGSDRDGNTQFSTRVTDANGIWKESYTNVRGLTKAVQEQYSQDSNVWTSYNYNAINELTEVKDDQGNLIYSSYDWFGRRTEVVHPDAGTTTYQYDLASNLTKKITANLKATGGDIGITYSYDHERLTEIHYPQNPQNNVTYTYGATGANNNRAGRILLQEDATGAQEFFYNQLGAVIKNIRTIVVPDSEFLTYTTQWEYDTWNRVTQMVYPDQETLTYNYNVGGLLHSMAGQKEGTDYSYVKQLGYDKFEQRVYLGYGNGTETFYTYEPERRRLQNMIAETADDRKMMDNVYTYDKVNNILRLQNNADIPTSNLMGGKTDYNYTYDDLYRLTNATGSHLGSNHENKYSLAMEYNSIHSIVKKDQLHQFKGYDETEWSPRNKTTYDYDYEYNAAQPHAPVHIGEQTYSYDANGNQTGWTHDVSGQQRQILWDEENRIKAIADNGAVFSYVYDAGGERVLKNNGGGQKIKVNGKKAGGSGSIGNYTIYVNPYVVIRNSQVTKHFYIESQRVVTKLAESSDGLLQEVAGSTTTAKVDYTSKEAKLKGSINNIYKAFGLDPITGEAGKSGQTPPNGNAWGYGKEHPDHPDNGNNGGGNGENPDGDGTDNSGGNGNNIEAFIFFYHPDHLGSSSYISDANGEVTQHIEYFAFGETFLEEHSNTDRTPYLFNGKELDEETGLYYYGARYYDAKTSVWQSVDPMILDDFLDGKGSTTFGVFDAMNLGVYSYSHNRPINATDPSGLDIVLYGSNGSSIVVKTSLISIEANVSAGAFAMDFGGNYTFEGKETLQLALDIVGVVDPTGAADVLNASIYLEDGKYLDAALSGAGVLILVGDLAKVGRLWKGVDRLIDIIKRKPCGCFIAGTLVLTEDGYISIEDVEIGDKVWAYDDETGGLKLKEVVDTFTRDFTQIYKIYYGDEVLEVTHEHPFFIGGKWLNAENLQEGDLLTLYDGSTKAIDRIEFVANGSFKVYNFTVEDYHTYYVSNTNVLVHNGNPCKFSSISKYLKNTKFGKKLNNISSKTNFKQGKDAIYEVNGKTGNSNLKKGDYFHLDSYHGNELEVYDKLGNPKAVLNLDGTLNASKTKAALKNHKSIKVN